MSHASNNSELTAAERQVKEQHESHMRALRSMGAEARESPSQEQSTVSCCSSPVYMLTRKGRPAVDREAGQVSEICCALRFWDSECQPQSMPILLCSFEAWANDIGHCGRRCLEQAQGGDYLDSTWFRSLDDGIAW
jgi:hypothetical protein